MNAEVRPIGAELCRRSVATPDDSGAPGADTVECSRCGWAGDPRTTTKGHCPECGCFVPTNTVRVTHGARRLASGRGTPLEQARIVAIEAAVVEDLGGEDMVSEVLGALVTDFAFAVVLRDLLARHFAAVCPLTAAGKRRAALTSWQQASARVEALARQIGTDRRATPVPSLSEYISNRQQARGPS